MVFQPRITASIWRRLFIFQADSPDTINLGGYVPNINNNADFNGDGKYYLANQSLSLNTTYIVSFRKYGTTGQIYLNGALASYGVGVGWTYSDLGSGEFTLFGFGGASGTGNYEGYFCEMIGYNGDTSNRRDSINRYLSNKWGVSI